jgi:hypothetical protein
MAQYIEPLSFYLFGVVLLLILVVFMIVFKTKETPCARLYTIIDFVKYSIVSLFMISASLILMNLWNDKQLEQKRQSHISEIGSTPVAAIAMVMKR